MWIIQRLLIRNNVHKAVQMLFHSCDHRFLTITLINRVVEPAAPNDTICQNASQLERVCPRVPYHFQISVDFSPPELQQGPSDLVY